MDKINFEGKSIEDAIGKAANQFDVNEDLIKYEVVEEGSNGILGFGSKPFVISAWTEEYSAVEDTPEEVVEYASPVGDAIEDKSVLMEEETNDDLFFEAAKTFIDTTIAKMGINVNVMLRNVNENVVAFDAVGDDIAILIGKYGATLDALQYIAGIVAYKNAPSKRRIIIDADGHRNKRIRDLEQKAVKIAEMVVKHGKEAVMEPQAARDRRIIHLALINYPGVKTYSEGEGMERHVIISPKDN